MRRLKSALSSLRQLPAALARLALVTSASLLLSGCIVSDGWLFTRADLATPIAPGRYIIETIENGSWKADDKPTNISLADGLYRINGNGPEGASISVYRISPRFFLVYVYTTQEGAQSYYFLLEPKEGRFLVYATDCKTFAELPAVKSHRPERLDGEGWSQKCVFNDRAKLVQAMLAYGETTAPTHRMTREDSPLFAKPASERLAFEEKTVVMGAPLVQVPKWNLDEKPLSARITSNQLKLFTLSVCNKSLKVAWFSLFHRNIYEREKWNVRGWWKVDPGKCADQRLPKGYFSIFAYAVDGTTWPGKDRHLCMVDRRAVDRVVFENEQCLAGETNRGFTQMFTKADALTYTLGR